MIKEVYILPRIRGIAHYALYKSTYLLTSLPTYLPRQQPPPPPPLH